MKEKIMGILEDVYFRGVIAGENHIALRMTEFFENVATQICQLYLKTRDNPNGYEPKPDESLLLSDKRLKIPKDVWKFFIKAHPDCDTDTFVDEIVAGCEAECQAKVKEIFEEIEQMSVDGGVTNNIYLLADDWQALKNKYIGERR